MKNLLEYKAFKSLGIGAPIPDGYEKIKVKIVYDCKHDYQRCARCVAQGDLIKNVDPESTYFFCCIPKVPLDCHVYWYIKWFLHVWW
jgi:hypothetical protein